jgi:cell division septation protein DedD
LIPDDQARYSLQAASFPNQAAAGEYVEKLIRAGVPAYTVHADIPGRGRWFRVRVGKFVTSDEAARYAAEARQRARAASVDLNLIVCDYQKP